MKLVVLGLSLSSSWGNGHATTFRALLRAFAERGHEVTFLERVRPWYAANRDLQRPDFCTLHLYEDLDELRTRHGDLVATADAVIVGSYVPDGIEVGTWVCDTAEGVRAFYDIDTPVTLARLAAQDCDYLDDELVARFDLYLSFAGGPALERLETRHGARMARALFCSVDTRAYRPIPGWHHYTLGYLGTFAADRQAKLDELLLRPARALPRERFAVVGPQYPDAVDWPANVERCAHLAPPAHPIFYNAQRYTLNLTRADMVSLGHCPSVRLFEAAACAVPIITDDWPGLADIFRPGEQVLVATDAEDVLRILRDTPETLRRAIGEAAHRVVLRHHSCEVRAAELERHLREARPQGAKARWTRWRADLDTAAVG